jgi:hypothetical protein
VDGIRWDMCAWPQREHAAPPDRGGAVTVRFMDDPIAPHRYAGGRDICEPPSSSMQTRSRTWSPVL